MILDGHIHITKTGKVEGQKFIDDMDQAGVDGGIVISLPPKTFGKCKVTSPWPDRIENLLEWQAVGEHVCGFFWVEPYDDDALEQIAAAVQGGAVGFKMICNHFPIRAERPMQIVRAIAQAGKPLLLHSGILWDGHESARFNRPGEFEALIEVERLKFTLAHIGWPWIDELIAVYGKFLNAHTMRPDLSVEMFVDNTPGTPEIYRREALTKVFTIGYDFDKNFIFGTDSTTDDYNIKWTRNWIEKDNAIYDELGLDSDVRCNIYANNLLRFLGVSDQVVQHDLPVSGR